MDKTDDRITFAADPRITFAAGGEGKLPTLRGYALVWNVLSSDRGGFRVRLKPGSARFDTPTFAYYEHDARQLLGNSEARTLRILPADDYGVPFELDLPDTTTGRDVAELVKRGDIRGMSFAMVRGAEKFSEVEEDGQKILDAEDYLVDEITVTHNPAFTATSVRIKRFSADAAPEAATARQEKSAPIAEEQTQESLKWEQHRHQMYDLDLWAEHPERG